jgi:hypothetical protein
MASEGRNHVERNANQLAVRCGDHVFPVSATVLRSLSPDLAGLSSTRTEIRLERSALFQDAVATMRAQHSRSAA